MADIHIILFTLYYNSITTHQVEASTSDSENPPSSSLPRGPSGLQSRNRPILLFLVFVNLFLNWFNDVAVTHWSSSEFHLFTTLLEKKYCRTSEKHRCFVIFSEWPLVDLPLFNWKNDSNLSFDCPFIILYTSIKSLMFLLSSKLHNSNFSSLSS